jgi:hypothetical protein
VPGFVTDTRLEPGARVVTFGNGMVVRELIIAIDDDQRRVGLNHFGQSLRIREDLRRPADLLPHEAAGAVGATLWCVIHPPIADQSAANSAAVVETFG